MCLLRIINMTKCTHPIFRYMGGNIWNAAAGRLEQRHKCIDCGHEEKNVPDGAIMVGHAPGECGECDRFAALLPDEQRERWVRLTAEGR